MIYLIPFREAINSDRNKNIEEKSKNKFSSAWVPILLFGCEVSFYQRHIYLFVFFLCNFLLIIEKPFLHFILCVFFSSLLYTFLCTVGIRTFIYIYISAWSLGAVCFSYVLLRLMNIWCVCIFTKEHFMRICLSDKLNVNVSWGLEIPFVYTIFQCVVWKTHTQWTVKIWF